MKIAQRIFTTITLAATFASLSPAQWVQTNGPYGGTVYCFTLLGDTLLVGTNQGGVFMSSDSARTWRASSTGLLNYEPITFALLESGLWTGTERGVYRSMDRGKTWSPPADTSLSSLSVFGITSFGNTLLVSTYGAGVFRSTDDGASWLPSSAGIPDTNTMCFLTTADTVGKLTLFVGTYGSGVYRSTDSGVTWTATGLTSGQVFSLLLVPVTPDSSLLFAGMDDRGVYRSTNLGKNWTRTTTGLRDSHIRALALFGSTLFSGSAQSGVFRSTDYGITWWESNGGKGMLGVLSLMTSGSVLYAGTTNSWGPSNGGGVYRSLDSGATWTQMNDGLINTTIKSIVEGLDATGARCLFAGAIANGLYSSTDRGRTWIHSPGGLDLYWVSALGASSNKAGGTDVMVAAPKNIAPCLSLTTDNGTTWTVLDTVVGKKDIRALAAIDTNWYAGTWQGVYRSTDRGLSWSALSSGLTNYSFNALVASPPGSAVRFLWAATAYGGFRLTELDTAWVRLDSGFAEQYVYGFAFDGSDIYSPVYGSGVYRSTDGGISWQLFNSGLEDLRVANIAVCPNGSGQSVVFVGGRGGIWCSSDRGEHWKAVKEGLPAVEVSSLMVSGTDLIAGTRGCGVFIRPLLEMITPIDDVEKESLASTCRLEQNYPNPFNPATRISYQIPRIRHVKLVVYDLLGRVVSVLVDERRAAGSHEVTFDGSYLASGVYFYQLRSGDFVQTRKFCLIR